MPRNDYFVGNDLRVGEVERWSEKYTWLALTVLIAVGSGRVSYEISRCPTYAELIGMVSTRRVPQSDCRSAFTDLWSGMIMRPVRLGSDFVARFSSRASIPRSGVPDSLRCA